jgi:hypothetical protein
MTAATTAMPASIADESLTPLDISQAVLEGEENPNVARPLTPKEQVARGAAVGGDNAPGRGARLKRALRSPAAVWCGAAATGIALALFYARRTSRI